MMTISEISIGQHVTTPGRGSHVAVVTSIVGNEIKTVPLRIMERTGPYVVRDRIENTNTYYAFDLTTS